MREMSFGLSMGRKLSNMAYSHGSPKFLSSLNYKNLLFLEFEIKRNSLRNSPKRRVFMCFCRQNFADFLFLRGIVFLAVLTHSLITSLC